MYIFHSSRIVDELRHLLKEVVIGSAYEVAQAFRTLESNCHIQ